MSNIEEDIKRCEELIKPEHANWIGISNQLAIAHVVDKVKELEAKLEFKKWGDLDNTQFEEYMNQFIPKQKIKDLLTEIQEEFNKLDKEIDKQIKDKNKDYYKCKENIAIMQTLAYCRDKFKELL